MNGLQPPSRRRLENSPPMRFRSPAFEQFRMLVEHDPSLQEQFFRPDDPRLFIALVVEAARDRGLSLDAAEIDAALRPHRHISADERSVRSPPRGWLPVQARSVDHALILDWAYCGSRRLVEP